MIRRIKSTITATIILITLLAISFTSIGCSPSCGPTTDELENIKPMVASITIGYDDGSTLELTPDSTHFNDVCDETLRIALSIDKQAKTVVDFQTVEQLSETHQKFVYISFAQPTEITTCIFIDKEERYHITTNEKGLRTLTLTEIVIWPQGTLPEIWTCAENVCGVWGSARSLSTLDDLTASPN